MVNEDNRPGPKQDARANEPNQPATRQPAQMQDDTGLTESATRGVGRLLSRRLGVFKKKQKEHEDKLQQHEAGHKQSAERLDKHEQILGGMSKALDGHLKESTQLHEATNKRLTEVEKGLRARPPTLSSSEMERILDEELGKEED